MQLEARLRAFAAFARRRSFSGAAEELRISQPAVSKHMAEIERELGIRLVERRKRGCVLTAAGEFFANHVLRAEAILAQAARGVAELRKPGSGSLGIVASGITGTYLLPEVIATFQQANPGVHVALELATTAKAVEALRSHRAELGVVGGFVAAPEIEAEPLVEDEIVVIGPRRLAGRQLARAELGAMTWISREEGSATRAAVEAACANLGIVPSRRLILPSWEAIKLAVKRGDGIAGCSRFAIAEELRTGLLWIIPVPRWSVRKMMSIIRVRDAALTPAAQQFVVMLRARWGQMGFRNSRRKATTEGDQANSRSRRTTMATGARSYS
jgi:LysR family transcriptional regulator, transcriptional activator of the cysJI operon